jgi:hypothetical protein
MPKAINLPALPRSKAEFVIYNGYGSYEYTAEDMRAYAQAALAADAAAQARGEPVAEVYSVHMQNDEAFATVRLLHKAPDYWSLKVHQGDKLYAAPHPTGDRT